MSNIMSDNNNFSHWNYRVVLTTSDSPDVKPEYAIHEVYYDDNGDMTMITERAVSPSGESLDDLEMLFIVALEKPVVVWDSKLKKPVERPVK